MGGSVGELVSVSGRSTTRAPPLVVDRLSAPCSDTIARRWAAFWAAGRRVAASSETMCRSCATMATCREIASRTSSYGRAPHVYLN